MKPKVAVVLVDVMAVYPAATISPAQETATAVLKALGGFVGGHVG